MKTQIKPTKKDSPAIHRGANRDNLPAVDYAVPHTMSGKKISGMEVMEHGEFAQEKAAKDVDIKDPIKGGVGYGMSREKTEGITMRGHGAAIKGIKSRGPMA